MDCNTYCITVECLFGTITTQPMVSNNVAIHSTLIEIFFKAINLL